MNALADAYVAVRCEPDSPTKSWVTRQFEAEVKADGPIPHQGWSYVWSYGSNCIIRFPTSKVARVARRSETSNIRVIPIACGHRRKALAL